VCDTNIASIVLFAVAIKRWAYNLSGFNKYGKSEINEVILSGTVLCMVTLLLIVEEC
jgi:ABC-type nickel/cobalt efflux system permease component RcnA